MVKKIIAVPIWHMQEFIYLIRSTTTHYLMLQPSHVYSPLQIVLLEVKIEPCGVCQWSVFISVQKSRRSMARAVAVLQNLIWEFELDGPQETVQ